MLVGLFCKRDLDTRRCHLIATHTATHTATRTATHSQTHTLVRTHILPLSHSLSHPLASSVFPSALWNPPPSQPQTPLWRYLILLPCPYCSSFDHNVYVAHVSALSETHCNTLQRSATHCNTRQHTATHRVDCVHVLPRSAIRIWHQPLVAILVKSAMVYRCVYTTHQDYTPRLHT